MSAEATMHVKDPLKHIKSYFSTKNSAQILNNIPVSSDLLKTKAKTFNDNPNETPNVNASDQI